jgi:hypothetical protein
MRELFVFKEVKIMKMNKEKLKKFLDDGGFTREINLIIRTVKVNEEKIAYLESRISRLESQNK